MNRYFNSLIRTWIRIDVMLSLLLLLIVIGGAWRYFSMHATEASKTVTQVAIDIPQGKETLLAKNLAALRNAQVCEQMSIRLPKGMPRTPWFDTIEGGNVLSRNVQSAGGNTKQDEFEGLAFQKRIQNGMMTGGIGTIETAEKLTYHGALIEFTPNPNCSLDPSGLLRLKQ